MLMLCSDRGHGGPVVAANAQRYLVLLFASILALPLARAAVCDPNELRGTYGFSLTGSTTIGGLSRSVAVLGRLVFDDSGSVSGI